MIILQKMKKFLVVLTLLVPVIAADRPRDDWIIRSNLDDRMGVLSLALSDSIWAAYELGKCGLYQIWDGGIHFRGFPLTNRPDEHITLGDVYHRQEESSLWSIVGEEGESQILPRFQGYRLTNQKTIHLLYKFDLGNGKIIEVEEIPEVEGSKTFVRTFLFKSLPPGKTLRLQITGESDGIWQISGSGKISNDGKSLLQESNGTTIIKGTWE